MEKEIGFAEYLEKINKRAIEKRKDELLKAKAKLKYWEFDFIFDFPLYLISKFEFEFHCHNLHIWISK